MKLLNHLPKLCSWYLAFSFSHFHQHISPVPGTVCGIKDSNLQFTKLVGTKALCRSHKGITISHIKDLPGRLLASRKPCHRMPGLLPSSM